MFTCYMDIYNDRFKTLQLKFLEVVFPSAQKSSLFGYERQRNLLGICPVNLLKGNIIYLKDNFENFSAQN